MNVVQWVKDSVRKVTSLTDHPHAIAGGLAIGVLVGFTPLFGLKTLLALGLAWLLRCNAIAAVVAVSLQDLLAPLLPFLLRMEYDIGYWLMSHPHQFPPAMELRHLHVSLSEMLNWMTFFHIGFPALIGSLVLSAPLAVLVYWLGLGVARAREKRKAEGEKRKG